MGLSRVTPLQVVSDARRAVETGLQRIGFWGSVVLPLAYGPLLYGGVTGSQRWVLAGVFVANVACLLVGHGHAR
jgi:hypothetical protein